MNRLILAAAFAAGFTLASSAPALAAAKTYDCSKAGNANKAVCKGTAKSAKAAVAPKATKAASAKPAPVPKPAKTATATTTTKSVTRNYDCTKAGNAKRAQCKSSTSAATSVTRPAPAAKAAPAPAQPGMFQRMKNALGGGSPAPAPAAKRAAAPRRGAATAPASVEDKNPAGAIAQCKDGTYSHAKARTGACSRHGGVAKWS
jgi:hypothetical protein